MNTAIHPKSVTPAILLAVLLASTGFRTVPLAADEPDIGLKWNLEALTSLALADDPELRAARDDARAASEQLRAAKAEWGPTLDLDLGASYLSDPLISVPAGTFGEIAPGMYFPAEDTDVVGQANDFRYDLSAILEQPLFTWGKISSGVNMAEAGSRASSWSALSREDEVVSSVRITCESLTILGRMRQLVDEQQALGDRLSVLTLSNFEEGFLLETEYRDTRNRLQQILLTASSLDKQTRDLLLILEHHTGLQGLELSDLDLPEVDVNPESFILPEAGSLVSSAWQANPDLMALVSLEDMASAEMDFARGNAGIKPDIALRTKFGYGGSFNGTPDQLDGTWTITIGAQSTLFDSGRSRADIRGSQAAASAAAARTENGRRQLESFVRSSIYTMGLHRENIGYFEGLRDTDAARAEQKKESWDSGYGREEEWLLAELDRLASELLRLREISSFIRLDREVRTAAGILD